MLRIEEQQIASKLTAEKVAQYFASLTKDEIRNNPAISAAGRAAAQLIKHAPGPGRPPSVEYKPSPPRPAYWSKLTHGEKVAWTKANGGPCRCADCRRKNFPSYSHKAFPKKP